MEKSSPRIAAAYIRVSTEDQTEFSPAAQLRELQDYAATHCLVLDQRYVYADEGISGRKAEKRPAFMQMMFNHLAERIFFVEISPSANGCVNIGALKQVINSIQVKHAIGRFTVNAREIGAIIMRIQRNLNIGAISSK